MNRKSRRKIIHDYHKLMSRIDKAVIPLYWDLFYKDSSYEDFYYRLNVTVRHIAEFTPDYLQFILEELIEEHKPIENESHY